MTDSTAQHGPSDRVSSGGQPGTRSASEPLLHELVETPSPGLLAEFWQFLRENKKWWLLPILLALLVLGLLAVLSGSGLGPFIYPFA